MKTLTTTNTPTTTQEAPLKIGHNSGGLCVDTKHGTTFCTANKQQYAQIIVTAVNEYDALKKKEKLNDELIEGLKYARRFLNEKDVDVNYIDQILKQAQIT